MATPTIYPIVPYTDLKVAVKWLGDAFGFTEHAVEEGPDGEIAHCELALGDGGMIMPTYRRPNARIPHTPGGVSWLYVVVEDPDAHHARAVAAGAEIIYPLTDQDYGSRDYSARDLDGNLWSFGTYSPYTGAS